MGEIRWRLTLEFAWRDDDEPCQCLDIWGHVEEPYITTLQFTDAKKAEEAYREARFALKSSWDDDDNPPKVRTNYAKRHNIKVRDFNGEELIHSLALIRIVEFVKVEKIHGI
jgi:hypothetical protein